MTNCIICLEEIKKTNNISILQSCNCFYNVHDKCIIGWYNKKKECLICHKPIRIHIPYVQEPTQHIFSRQQNEVRPEYIQNQPPRPRRMNFFYRLFSCCIR